MREYALTNTKLAVDSCIYMYCEGKSEKDVLRDWINSEERFKNCKVIRKPKDLYLKHGAKYCFEHNNKYYYAYKAE